METRDERKEAYTIPITSKFQSILSQAPPSPSSSFFYQSSKPGIRIKLRNALQYGLEIILPASTPTTRVQTLLAEMRRLADVASGSHASCLDIRRSASELSNHIVGGHSWLNFYPVEEHEELGPTSPLGALSPAITTPATAWSAFLSPAAPISRSTLSSVTSSSSPSALLPAANPETDVADISTADNPSEKASTTDVQAAEILQAENFKSEASVREEFATISSAEEHITEAPEAAMSKLEVSAIQTLSAEALPKKEVINEAEEFPNPFLPSFHRVKFTRKRLFKRQDRWSTFTPIKIRTATYNVNDKLPPPSTTEMSALVGDGGDDLLVFGFQEVDLRNAALLVSQGTVRADAWEKALFDGLGDQKDEFEKLSMNQYVGVMVIVLVRKSLKGAISRVETSERGIGLLGFGGNKAGVAIRLRIHDTTLCFVNCHLAAMSTALDRRRLDFSSLLKGLSFPKPFKEEVNPTCEAFWPDDGPLGVEDSDVLFWMGDLNYRIEMADEKVKALAAAKNWAEILEKDQLNSDIASGLSFAGFKEHPITFLPTFKYVHNSLEFDYKRAPAYTDRILFVSPDNSTICCAYKSHPILWSDHLPVSASFEVQARVVDEAKQKIALDEIAREFDKLEQVYQPSLHIPDDGLEFGQIAFGQSKVMELKIENNGRVDAEYGFKPTIPSGPICKPFIWPSPPSLVVKSGEEVVLKVVVNVEEKMAQKLTLGEEDLNDVLVLRVKDGKDTFITIQSTFLPTIITLPLTTLSTLPNSIRNISLADRKLLAEPKTGIEQGEEENKRVVKPPKEIWRLLEHLMQDGTKADGLWVGDAKFAEILQIVEALDTGSPIDSFEAMPISKALLYILSVLSTPLVPSEFARRCEAANDRDEAFTILEELNAVHTNVSSLVARFQIAANKDKEANAARLEAARRLSSNSSNSASRRSSSFDNARDPLKVELEKGEKEKDAMEVLKDEPEKRSARGDEEGPEKPAVEGVTQKRKEMVDNVIEDLKGVTLGEKEENKRGLPVQGEIISTAAKSKPFPPSPAAVRPTSSKSPTSPMTTKVSSPKPTSTKPLLPTSVKQPPLSVKPVTTPRIRLSSNPTPSSPPVVDMKRSHSNSSASKPLAPSVTGPRRGSVQLHSPALVPLRPQLTGTPNKPTASSLAKARPPTSSPGLGSGNGVEKKTAPGSIGRSAGSKAAVTPRPRDGITSPTPALAAGVGRSGSIKRSTTTPTTHSVRKSVLSPDPTPTKTTTTTPSSSTPSRLMQGTASSRLKAAEAASVKSPPKSSTPPIAKPLARTPSTVKRTGLTTKPPAKEGVGRAPIGRLGLAAAGIKKPDAKESARLLKEAQEKVKLEKPEGESENHGLKETSGRGSESQAEEGKDQVVPLAKEEGTSPEREARDTEVEIEGKTHPNEAEAGTPHHEPGTTASKTATNTINDGPNEMNLDLIDSRTENKQLSTPERSPQQPTLSENTMSLDQIPDMD
ncbi:inositol polyphosphate 5-phosphatase INPP5B/F, partial [Tremellales sp. Uapishka_1]